MYKHESGVIVSNSPASSNPMASHAQIANRPTRRPAHFCYHCNKNFPTRELLEDHVKQISIRSAGQKRAESAVIEEEYHEGIHVNPHREEPHQDEYGPSHDELTMRQRIHHQNDIRKAPRAKRRRVLVHEEMQENDLTSGHDFSASSVKVESGFFDLSRAEITKIKTQNEYAAFTVDGKECYHCGDEFTNRQDLISHPRKCMRMKNANFYGKIIHGDGTLEEINESQMSEINQQQSHGNGNHQMSNHEQEQEHGALIIDQADEVIHEEEYETATKLEQGVNDQEWQPAVQCPLCNEFFENKAAVKLHRYQCVMDRALKVRKPGQPINTQHKGFCCFHCDRLFPTREELRIHVNEVNSQNLRY